MPSTASIISSVHVKFHVGPLYPTNRRIETDCLSRAACRPWHHLGFAYVLLPSETNHSTSYHTAWEKLGTLRKCRVKVFHSSKHRQIDLFGRRLRWHHRADPSSLLGLSWLDHYKWHNYKWTPTWRLVDAGHSVISDRKRWSPVLVWWDGLLQAQWLHR